MSKGTPNLKKKLIKRPSFLSDKENLKPIQNDCIFNPRVARIEDVLLVQPSSSVSPGNYSSLTNQQDVELRLRQTFKNQMLRSRTKTPKSKSRSIPISNAKKRGFFDGSGKNYRNKVSISRSRAQIRKKRCFGCNQNETLNDTLSTPKSNRTQKSIKSKKSLRRSFSRISASTKPLSKRHRVNGMGSSGVDGKFSYMTLNPYLSKRTDRQSGSKDSSSNYRAGHNLESAIGKKGKILASSNKRRASSRKFEGCQNGGNSNKCKAVGKGLATANMNNFSMTNAPSEISYK